MTLAKIAEALNKAQAVMSGAKKDKKNPFFKSSYADLASVFDAIREPFGSNGLSVTQTMDVLDNGRTILITRLMHSSGEYLASRMILPDIADPQKLGSAITYYRRYSLMAIAGIPAEDDDGNSASNKKVKPLDYITTKQVEDIKELIGDDKEILDKVLEQCGGHFAAIQVEQYPAAITWINNLKEGK